MKKRYERFQKWMMAITFAEAGEWDTARQMMPPARKTVMFPALQGAIDTLQKTFMAAAFAEGGLHEEAIRLVGDKKPHAAAKTYSLEDFLEAIGLDDAPVTYATVGRRVR